MTESIYKQSSESSDNDDILVDGADNDNNELTIDCNTDTDDTEYDDNDNDSIDVNDHSSDESYRINSRNNNKQRNSSNTTTTTMRGDHSNRQHNNSSRIVNNSNNVDSTETQQWQHFTADEMNALIDGVSEYGHRWVMILNDKKYGSILWRRDARSLEKACYITYHNITYSIC